LQLWVGERRLSSSTWCVAVALQCVAVFVWREETCAESGERSLSASIWFATDALQLCCSCVAVVCCSRCIV